MKMVQVEFHQPDGHEYGAWINKKVVWVDVAWNLKEGERVTFKGETKRWIVWRVYGTISEMADLDKKWGLDLPKSQRTER
jgi:hypothetical protein